MDFLGGGRDVADGREGVPVFVLNDLVIIHCIVASAGGEGIADLGFWKLIGISVSGIGGGGRER